MIGPKDAEPVARIWIEQLDRRDVSPELYDELLNRAVDYRTGYLQRGEQPPSLTVELLIAMFDKYRAEKRSEFSKLFPVNPQWEYFESMVLGTAEFSLSDGTPAQPYPPERLLEQAQWHFKREFTSFEEMKAFVSDDHETRPARRVKFWIDAHLPSEISPKSETRWING